MNLGEIQYSEKNGKLWYCYEHYFDSYQTKIIEGGVPDNIAKKGKAAIKKYVEKSITAILKKDERFRVFGNNLNVPISVQHNGVLLKGKITYAGARTIDVCLEKPKKYAGESWINFGFASAVAGRYVFEAGDEPKLSRAAIEGAKEVLKRIYNEKKNQEDNKEIIDLAEKLNKKSK